MDTMMTIAIESRRCARGESMRGVSASGACQRVRCLEDDDTLRLRTHPRHVKTDRDLCGKCSYSRHRLSFWASGAIFPST